MRDDGIWNPRLAAVIARAGHGDLVVIADPGFPVPADVETIDLVWARNEPRFLPVVDAVAHELTIELAFAASEATDATRDDLARALPGVRVEQIPHDELKHLVRTATVVVRTGEATPYSNVVLHCGVPF